MSNYANKQTYGKAVRKRVKEIERHAYRERDRQIKKDKQSHMDKQLKTVRQVKTV